MSGMTAKNNLSSSSRDSFFPNESLSLVTVCLDDETLGLVKAFAESATVVRLLKQIRDYSMQDHNSILEWIGDPAPNVCLVDFDRDRRSAASVAERIHAEAPETAIFAVSSESQADAILGAMRSGCSEYLVKPVDRDALLNAIARVGGRKKEKKETARAEVMAFIGAKGGCGVTTLVTQLAAQLSSSYSRKTLVIDLHPDFGDAALYLGLTKYRYHFFELLENTDRLDAELLQSFVMHHTSGVDVIPAPEGIELARHVIPGTVAQTFDFLRLRYEFILVDLPPGLNDENVELIRYCDQLHLITVAEVSAVRNVVRHVDYLNRKEMLKEKVRVVLNRHHKRDLITEEQIEKAIRQKLFWKVPNQYVQVVKTNSGGDSGQISTSEVTRNLKEWAAAIGRKAAAGDIKKENRGILGRWNL